MIQRHRTLPESSETSPRSMVQGGSANPQSITLGKGALCRPPFTNEANAAKGNALRGTERHAESFKRYDRLGHQPFTTGLVDRRLRNIRHHHMQAALPDRNRRGQPRRAATHDEHIGLQYIRDH